jgi:quercetin dioxygenase-like cupin family protein
MTLPGIDVRRFDRPDETRTFEKGRLDLITIGDRQLGRATYEPGWRWTDHVAAIAGTRSCEVPHLGMVLEGRAMIAMDDGPEYVVGPGDVFAVAPGHDSWVVGDAPYVSLHLLGADAYAT